MSTYEARIGTPDGAIAVRTIEAPDEETARSEVTRQGGRIFSIRASKQGVRAKGRGLGAFLPGRRGVKLQEFIVFNQELVALLRAGLPIVSGFEILIERQENPRFKKILIDVRDQLVSGVSMSDAFLAHGDEFPRLYATSLKAGERSGEVATVLKRFLAYQKILGSVKRRVTGALVYPAVLIGLSVVLILVLMTYVIPKFTEFYAGFQAGELPALTRFVVGTATLMKEYVAWWLSGLVIAIILLRRFVRTDRGTLVWDSLKLKFPIVGRILHQFALSQFSRALATLVGAGTPLVPALEISSGSIANRRISSAVTSVVPRVREGAELWKSLEDTGQFTSLSVEMIKVGEATGALEEMLTNVAEFYDESIEAALQKLITLIEPVILIVMGGVIATILLSIYLPMFTILSNIKA